MKSLTNLLLFILIPTAFTGCKKELERVQIAEPKQPTQLVDDKTIHNVIQSVLAIKRVGEREENYYITNVVDGIPYDELGSEDSIILKKTDTIFTKEDINFIYEQAKYKRHFKIKREFLKEYTILPSDTLLREQQKAKTEKNYNFWQDFRRKYGNGLYTITMPLFTKNKQFAMVSISNCCGGLCGSGTSHILKNTKSGWMIIYTYNYWLS